MITDLPLTPDSPTAQRWARDELAQNIYHPRQNPVEWLLAKITGIFDRLSGTDQAGNAAVWIAVALLLAAIVIAIVVIGPMRRRRAATMPGTELVSPDLTADDLRQLAREAFAAQDWTRATLLAYRVLVQSSIERTILPPLPGLTAHEASAGIARLVPDLGQEVVSAGATFDSLVYGGQHASRSQAQTMLALDQELARTRPVFSTEPDQGQATAILSGRSTLNATDSGSPVGR